MIFWSECSTSIPGWLHWRSRPLDKRHFFLGSLETKGHKCDPQS